MVRRRRRWMERKRESLQRAGGPEVRIGVEYDQGIRVDIS
jgi:hypothetical protein